MTKEYGLTAAAALKHASKIITTLAEEALQEGHANVGASLMSVGLSLGYTAMGLGLMSTEVTAGTIVLIQERVDEIIAEKQRECGGK